MNTKIWTVFLMLMSSLLVACGGSAVTIKNIAEFPNAKEIAQSDSQLFDSISKLAKTSTALQMVVNAKEKKIYRLDKNAAWADVRLFYEKSMDSAEWQLVPPTAALLEQVKLPNDISAYNVELWIRGNQSVGIVHVTSSQSTELFVGLNAP